MIDLIQEVPESLRGAYSQIVALCDRFCGELLNEEYRDLCRQVAARLSRPDSPIVEGEPAGWASGIVFAVGWVNSLTDPRREPHVPAEAIAQWFGVAVETMEARSQAVREKLELDPVAPDFMLPSRLGEHPLTWLVEVNGRLLDARVLAPEVQAAAFEEGLIPYLPAA